MKKNLLVAFIVFFASISNSTFGQGGGGACDLSFANLITTPVGIPTPIGTDKCQYTFNASFDITTNSGFKYLFFHTWIASEYPNPAIFDCTSNAAQDPGTETQLGTAIDDVGKSILDLGFENLNIAPFVLNTPLDVTSFIATLYPEDNDVVLIQPLNSPGMTAVVTKLPGDVLHFELTNVRIIINTPCGTPIITRTDIWGSNQNAGAPKAHCTLCGALNVPEMTLTKSCQSLPFTYQVDITTQSVSGYNVVYKVYMDEDDDGIQEPNGDDGPPIFTSGTILVSLSSPYSSGAVALTGPNATSQDGVYAQLTATEFANTVSTAISDPICLVFPVKLISFSAVRNQLNVDLNWQTANEANNIGFDIERIIGSGNWQKIGFVASQGKAGSSSNILNYKFTDLNNASNELSQYRLKQIDMDGRFEYSPIRIVKNDGKNVLMVYPNPSRGSFGVVFPEKEFNYNVTLYNTEAKLVKNFKNCKSVLNINGLKPGIYLMKIENLSKKEIVTNKIIVQ